MEDVETASRGASPLKKSELCSWAGWLRCSAPRITCPSNALAPTRWEQSYAAEVGPGSFIDTVSLPLSVPQHLLGDLSLSSLRVARYNRTSYFYPTTFSESSEHSHLLVSPVLVASAVIGVVITLSCITIIVGSIRRDRQARIQRHHHRHRRHHHHHRHRRRRHREYVAGVTSMRAGPVCGPPHLQPRGGFSEAMEGLTFTSLCASGGHTHSRSSPRMPYACSPAEDWPPPLDVSSEGDVDVTVLWELYPDSPPGYEECMGPGATQLYVPTDAPPPYSMTDSCPRLNGALDSDSGQSRSHRQQEQRTQGQSRLHTVSMDTLPPYEAVCGTGSPSDLLPLPGKWWGQKNIPAYSPRRRDLRNSFSPS